MILPSYASYNLRRLPQSLELLDIAVPCDPLPALAFLRNRTSISEFMISLHDPGFSRILATFTDLWAENCASWCRPV
jgi:hypothetical protein